MNRTILATTSLGIAAIMLISCQDNNNNHSNDNEISHKTLSEQAIEVHDEIMPQISKFDKTAVKIDSILNGLSASKSEETELDTTTIRTELTALKQDIESATGSMMDWMRNYKLDSTDVSYQQSEVERIKLMRTEFDQVNQQIDAKMKSYVK